MAAWTTTAIKAAATPAPIPGWTTWNTHTMKRRPQAGAKATRTKEEKEIPQGKVERP